MYLCTQGKPPIHPPTYPPTYSTHPPTHPPNQQAAAAAAAAQSSSSSSSDRTTSPPPPPQGGREKTYDEELGELHRVIQVKPNPPTHPPTPPNPPTHPLPPNKQGWIQTLSQDPSPPPSTHPPTHPSSLARRALLEDVMRLALFFGQETTLDHLIPLLSTFFNDKVSLLPTHLLLQ